MPTTKDQCKKDGWQSFGIFKNQGDCVSFVATGGKNGPAVRGTHLERIGEGGLGSPSPIRFCHLLADGEEFAKPPRKV